jgi:hypothetical protein
MRWMFLTAAIAAFSLCGSAALAQRSCDFQACYDHCLKNGGPWVGGAAIYSNCQGYCNAVQRYCATSEQQRQRVIPSATNSTAAAKIIPATKETSTERVVLTDTKTRVHRYWHLNEDCTVAGPITVKIIKPPTNGTLEIESGPGYSNYPQDDVRAKCNLQQTELTSVWYKSKSDFVGQDQYEVEAFYLNIGRSIKTKTLITVK